MERTIPWASVVATLTGRYWINPSRDPVSVEEPYILLKRSQRWQRRNERVFRAVNLEILSINFNQINIFTVLPLIKRCEG